MKTGPLPPWWQVNEIQQLPTKLEMERKSAPVATESDSPAGQAGRGLSGSPRRLAENLVHLPDEPAGVLTGELRYIVRPPSTTRHWPVASEVPVARKRTASAMSSGSAARCMGKWAVRFSSSSGDITARSQRVSTGPGQTALTRISGPSARASDLVIVLRAPLLAA